MWICKSGWHNRNLQNKKGIIETYKTTTYLHLPPDQVHVIYRRFLVIIESCVAHFRPSPVTDPLKFPIRLSRSPEDLMFDQTIVKTDGHLSYYFNARSTLSVDIKRVV